MRNVAALVMLALAGCGRLEFDAVRCASLPSTCGPTGTSNCCESRMVTGGTFYRSYDVAADMAYPDTSSPATVSRFSLDTYEVTVGRFREFVEAGMGTQANPPAAGAGARTLDGMTNQGGWDPAWNVNLAVDTTALVAALECDASYQTWTATRAGSENRPIGCITWYEAMAFCAWDGGHLPTEAESMYAASGGSLQRAYPWSRPPSSTTIDCTVTNYGGPSWPTTGCVGGAHDVGSVSPQGDGVWGQADLGGNVWEWCWTGICRRLPRHVTTARICSKPRSSEGSAAEASAVLRRLCARPTATRIRRRFAAIDTGFAAPVVARELHGMARQRHSPQSRRLSAHQQGCTLPVDYCYTR